MASFDLIVATVDRVDPLAGLLDSLERQTHKDFRVLVVDQNDDDRVGPLVRERSFPIERVKSTRGLSRARNAALPLIRADVVAFPDDDCVYPEDLLARVSTRLHGIDGLTARGGPTPPWKSGATILTPDNLWNRAISYTLFLRRGVVEMIGQFDEHLGLPISSGEEIDYLIRALHTGARIEYDPALVIEHTAAARDARTIGARDGRSIGYILRKHRYPPRIVARMLVRPAAGALLAFAKNDRDSARFHLATFGGRVRGLLS